MNEVSTYREQLPDTLEDLTQFVLVGRSKLNAYKIKLQTVNRLSDAQSIREQTLQDMQDVSIAIVAAEQRIGEILLSIEKRSGGDHKSDNFKNRGDSNFEKTKAEVASNMGYSKDQVSEYQRMAQNPDVVKAVIDEAVKNGEMVTRTQVMKEIKAIKAEIAEKDKRIAELQSREPEVREVVKEVVPSDYESLRSDLRNAKRQADAWKQDYRNEQNKVANQAKEVLRLQEEVDELKRQTVNEQNNNDLNGSALTFAMECRIFLQNMGGYTFVAEHLMELNERERQGYIVAAKAMRDWASILIETINKNKGEKYGIYGNDD